MNLKELDEYLNALDILRGFLVVPGDTSPKGDTEDIHKVIDFARSDNDDSFTSIGTLSAVQSRFNRGSS